MAKLTKRTVEALTPGQTDVLPFDEEVPRFGVRIMPSGVKSYLIQYRSGGRTRRYTFAKHGLVTTDKDARRPASFWPLPPGARSLRHPEPRHD